MDDYRPAEQSRPTFFRTNSARKILPAPVDDLYCGTAPAPLFVIAPGPSLDLIPPETREDLFACPIPKIGLNRLPPMPLNFWTAYDTWFHKDGSARYDPELLLDPRVMKLLPRARAQEMVPQTSIRGYQLANTFFFGHEYRDAENLFDARSTKIINLRDTWPQTIDVAYRLGFRKLFLVGQDQRIRLSSSQLEFCSSLGMEFSGDYLEIPDRGSSDKLVDVANEVKRIRGVDFAEACRMLDEAGDETQYAEGCDKGRDFSTAVTIDRHYWTAAQLIRQARPHLAQIGLELFSCTPGSRWNTTLPYLPLETVIEEYYHPFRDTLPTASLIDVDAHCKEDRKPEPPKAEQNGHAKPAEPKVHRPTFADPGGLGFHVPERNGD